MRLHRGREGQVPLLLPHWWSGYGLPKLVRSRGGRKCSLGTWRDPGSEVGCFFSGLVPSRRCCQASWTSTVRQSARGANHAAATSLRPSVRYRSTAQPDVTVVMAQSAPCQRRTCRVASKWSAGTAHSIRDKCHYSHDAKLAALIKNGNESVGAAIKWRKKVDTGREGSFCLESAAVFASLTRFAMICSNV